MRGPGGLAREWSPREKARKCLKACWTQVDGPETQFAFHSLTWNEFKELWKPGKRGSSEAQVPALQGETETKVRDVTRQTLGWRWGLDATDNQGLSLDDRLFWLVSLADGCPPITARQEAMTVDPACPHTGAITPVKVTKPFWGVTRPFLRIISLWRNLTDDDESKSKWINELLRK